VETIPEITKPREFELYLPAKEIKSVAQESVNLKQSLVLTRMLRFKPASEFVEGSTALRVVN
jgi:hypothetical protein